MKVQVISGSIREGRATTGVAKWVAAEAGKINDFEVELVDLADYDLPMFDEAISPRYNPNRKPEGKVAKWLGKLAEADGYIIVSPEYNRGMPGALKNALDFLDYQLERKPVALLTHGASGGVEAAVNLRLILRGVGAVAIPQSVTLSYGQAQNQNGELEADPANNPSAPRAVLAGMLEHLGWWTKTLKAGRDQAK